MGQQNVQRKTVCHLTSGHTSFDDRIFHKEAVTLAKAGYEVVLIAQHDKEETVDGVKILPLPKPRNRFERMTKVVWKLFRLALKEKADIYHFHEPELIPIGLTLKLFGKKVIYDVHEDYSEQILHKEWVGSYIFRKVVSVAFKLLEKIAARIFDRVVVVTPDIAQKFPEYKTVMLRNFPILELIDKVEPANRKSNKPIVIYVGVLARIRGIREIIQAIGIVKDKAELWLLGKWESEEFEKECEDLEGFKYTKYLGFVPLGEVYKYIKGADIGLHCIYRTEYYMKGLPIKVFEYAAGQLPIVISNSDYWRGEFGEFALFVDPKKPEDIADKILILIKNETLRSRLGKNARKFIEKDYNWECESEKLLKLYESTTIGGSA